MIVIIAIGLIANAGYASTYTEDSEAISGFIVDDFQVNNAPLPAAIWLFALALLGLFGINRKFQQTA